MAPPPELRVSCVTLPKWKEVLNACGGSGPVVCLDSQKLNVVGSVQLQSRVPLVSYIAAVRAQLGEDDPLLETINVRQYFMINHKLVDFATHNGLVMGEKRSFVVGGNVRQTVNAFNLQIGECPTFLSADVFDATSGKEGAQMAELRRFNETDTLQGFSNLRRYLRALATQGVMGHTTLEDTNGITHDESLHGAISLQNVDREHQFKRVMPDSPVDVLGSASPPVCGDKRESASPCLENKRPTPTHMRQFQPSPVVQFVSGPKKQGSTPVFPSSRGPTPVARFRPMPAPSAPAPSAPP